MRARRARGVEHGEALCALRLDIPNDRQLRWDEVTSRNSVTPPSSRRPSNFTIRRHLRLAGPASRPASTAASTAVAAMAASPRPATRTCAQTCFEGTASLNAILETAIDPLGGSPKATERASTVAARYGQELEERWDEPRAGSSRDPPIIRPIPTIGFEPFVSKGEPVYAAHGRPIRVSSPTVSRFSAVTTPRSVSPTPRRRIEPERAGSAHGRHRLVPIRTPARCGWQTVESLHRAENRLSMSSSELRSRIQQPHGRRRRSADRYDRTEVHCYAPDSILKPLGHHR